jgi:ribonuclease BN (tRNA processing enzyme)
MRLHVLGCGDAFGSGGRFNTCFHVLAGTSRFLVDCGASSMVAMRRFGVDPNTIETILISHLHGDHFGGLPFLLLDAQYVSGRKTPLTIAGPSTLSSRLHALREAMFPGSAAADLPFRLEIVEMEAEQSVAIGELQVTPFEVRHPSGAPSFALRCEVDGHALCYSGDTEWVEALGRAARHADLFIAETFTFDRQVPFHTTWATLQDHLGRIGAKRVLLTHMSADMLECGSIKGAERAEDGMVIEF